MAVTIVTTKANRSRRELCTISQPGDLISAGYNGRELENLADADSFRSRKPCVLVHINAQLGRRGELRPFSVDPYAKMSINRYTAISVGRPPCCS